MGINYESRSIGSVRPIALSGAQMVGASQLQFSLAWQLHPKSSGTVYTVVNTSIWVSVRCDEQPAAAMLGQADPETAWCDESREGEPFERPLLYRLTLAHDQLLALEESRRGRGLCFILDVCGNTLGPHGFRAMNETIQLAVNASDWSRILKEAGVAEILLVGVHIPSDRSVSGTQAALGLVRKANEHVTGGHYDAAVAECRRAIESIWKLGHLQDDAIAARKGMASGNEQRRMSKRDRELALGEAIKNFCNSAHHVGDDAEPEIFSRSDAALAVAGTAGLISSLIASPDWIKPKSSKGANTPLAQPVKPAEVPIAFNGKAASPAPKPIATDVIPSLAAQVTKVRQHLKAHPNNRPGTLRKLRSALESLFAKRLIEQQLTELIAELIKRKIVVETAGKLSYP